MKTPRTSHYRKEIILPATPQALWDFHADVQNMPRVLPPGQKLRAIQGDPEPRTGNEFTLHLSLYGVPVKWRIRWKACERPGLLWDEMVEGPFAVFSHQHIFEPVSDTETRMIDDVEYALPASRLTWPLAETALRLQMRAMFTTRHQRTLAHFSGKADPRATS